MINSSNALSLIDKLIRPNIKLIILFSILIILLFQYLDTNIIFILSFLLTCFLYHKDIMNILIRIEKEENKNEKLIEDNKRLKKEINFNEEITQILHKLKKYRKYNTNAYDDGYKQLKMFMFMIHDLERIDIAHPKQYFENAELYLKNTLNNFQSMSISVPEENLNQALKYDKYETTKLGNKIGKLCKKLHKHCHYLLFNLSLRLNEKWKEKPDIYMSEITINLGNVLPNDMNNHDNNIY